jgi:hypothetical protein
LYKGFAIRLRIFSCRLARSNFLFLFLPIVRQGAVSSNCATENRCSAPEQDVVDSECPIECGPRNDPRFIDAVRIIVALSLLLS